MGKIILLILVIVLSIIGILEIKKLYKKLINIKLNNFIKNTTIDSIDSLTGDDFEEFLYYLFFSLGFDVKKTKKSHDFGADLIIKVKDITICIQCKLYYNHNVGTSAIQEVYSATKYYNSNAGIVITNTRFTKSAVKLSETTNIILWDRDMLIKLLNLNTHEKKSFKLKLMYKILNTM